MAKIKDVVEGLTIIAVYCGDESHDICAEHDVIYAGPELTAVTDDDRKKLEDRGWHWDDEAQSWARFV